jgi:DNA-binding beta-propeller fold protein YncE
MLRISPTIIACFVASQALAVDISDPSRLMFVADTVDNIIDVVDIADEEVVFRIETKHPVDDVVATPYAPILVYTNIEQRLVSVYDLRKQKLYKEIRVPIAPRHMVIDTTGSNIGLSDSVDGGFVLFSAYTAGVVFTLEDFPPTSDVLFDPNEIDIYYTNDQTGSLGIIDTNQRRTVETRLADEAGQALSSPSRSLDGRYVYVANETTGEVYSLNAFSRVIYRSFELGENPARPYTSPEGAFLYMMDKASGRFLSIEQNRFEVWDDAMLGEGIDLVTVGRFDRMNLIASTENRNFFFYDNLRKSVVSSGQFEHTPLDAFGSADGVNAYVAFGDGAQVAVVNLEDQEIRYIPAANNGIGAFSIGLSNNVCH